MTLVQKGPGFEGPIRSLEGNTVLVSRLLELGFVPDEKIRIEQVALFGEPILVKVRGALVALRRSEAECIQL